VHESCLGEKEWSFLHIWGVCTCKSNMGEGVGGLHDRFSGWKVVWFWVLGLLIIGGRTGWKETRMGIRSFIGF